MVRIDQERGIIDATLAGFLTADEIEGYGRDVQSAIVTRQFYRDYLLIIDVSGCPIQSQETLAALATHMAAMPRARRLAVVVGDSPATGQARRLFTQSDARLVRTREQGIIWIISGIDPTPRAVA